MATRLLLQLQAAYHQTLIHLRNSEVFVSSMITLNILIMSYMKVLKSLIVRIELGTIRKRGCWRVTYETLRQASIHLRNFEGYIHIKTLNAAINPCA